MYRHILGATCRARPPPSAGVMRGILQDRTLTHHRPVRLGTLPSGQSPPSPLYGTMSHTGYLRAGPLRDLSGLG